MSSQWTAREARLAIQLHHLAWTFRTFGGWTLQSKDARPVAEYIKLLLCKVDEAWAKGAITSHVYCSSVVSWMTGFAREFGESGVSIS